MKKETPTRRRVTLKTYSIIADTVAQGVAIGVNRAYKHTDDPSRESLMESVEREVLNALCDVIDM
jgi:hypothetical protein